jgi:hypothetical protein
MKSAKALISTLIALIFCLPIAVAQAQPTLLASLPRPDGVTTDPNGNIFVVADATSAKVLVILAPNGSVLDQLPLPGTSIADVSTNNLVYDPVLGSVWDLQSDGDIFLLNPGTGEGSFLFNIRALPIDISRVYDVVSGTIGSISGIVPQSSIYGDLAILWRGETLDLLVSARSVVFPFVMRIRFVQGRLSSARVLISTNAPESAANQPRGVAVNAQGVVLTTVPITSFGEAVYAFVVDFPETQNGLPVRLLPGVLSSGMTTDGNGTFYIAGQNTVCGGDTSALLFLLADLSAFGCIPSGGSLFGSGYDVTVSPTAAVAYTTSGNAVLAWPLGR